MGDFLEVSKKAFDSYKKDLISTIIFGLAYALAMILSVIPILGAIIAAYLFPRILGWYYSKTIGNINPNYSLAFKICLIMLLSISIVAIILMFLPENILNKLLYFFIIKMIILGTLLYPLYASILGKINKIEIDLKKSFILLFYLFIWSLILIVVPSLLLFYTLFFILYAGVMSNLNYIFLIFATLYIILLGIAIGLLFFILFTIPFVNLILAHKVLSL